MLAKGRHHGHHLVTDYFDGLEGSDHDFEPESKLKLFGIAIPEWDENYFFLPKALRLLILWSIP